ncbi:MAG: hypothetical protein OYH76_26475 [Defluviicoccus sp.]|nr:hypothetical protein [Defluviicoccus sp.]MDE0279453.1 hypothetical protein [Defluviicoccus sp.]
MAHQVAREGIARTRLLRIIGNHGICNARTLEQKISDAGPYSQRIDPHILIPVRNDLVKDGFLRRERHLNAPWFFLPSTPDSVLEQRLNEQLPIFRRLQHGDTGMRIGQCLEIAIYRGLLAQEILHYLGSFPDLDTHDDSLRYSKEEPPQSVSGRRLAGDQRLDFLVLHPTAGWAGLEAKNVREWLYPDRDEIRDLLAKAVALDCVPVLIARRFPFVTFKVLSTCGVLFHQTYNQLLPVADSDLADQARDKRLLGYHDIRVGNEPDKRLTTFLTVNLPNILPEARDRFDEYKDLLTDFSSKAMTYEEFAARVRRRSQGLYEDGDWDPPFS